MFWISVKYCKTGTKTASISLLSSLKIHNSVSFWIFTFCVVIQNYVFSVTFLLFSISFPDIFLHLHFCLVCSKIIWDSFVVTCRMALVCRGCWLTLLFLILLKYSIRNGIFPFTSTILFNAITQILMGWSHKQNHTTEGLEQQRALK